MLIRIGKALCAGLGLGLGLASIAACSLIASCSNDDEAGVEQIKHVFVIALENKNYDDTFGTSTQDPYLQSLKTSGALLTHYYGTGHASLDNYISMISGQATANATSADCANYDDFLLNGTTADGQAIGDGCVYPTSIKTLPDQLKAAGLSWKGYMGDMGNDPARENATCGHPAIGAKDLTQTPEAPSASVPAGDQYAARHNPFVYFHSIIDTEDCDKNVVSLPQLDTDLASIDKTPNFTFVTPNLCDDGHDGDGTGAAGKGCVDGKPGGLKSSDEFLKVWVPKILASPAFKKDGLLVITFDEGNYTSVSPSTVDGKTTVTITFPGESCCNQPIGPNITRPSAETIAVSPTTTYVIKIDGHGGDRVGAVMLSPFIKGGTVSDVPYNHYSLLKTLQNIYRLSPYLGYAGQDGLAAMDTDVFSGL
ncbi:MAG: phosphoesterase [Hydrocarboniphaga sp.]|uniref:alkaline phosphatase family protein n=1 Tax=Hydrocarboniphaga sp. TaxID=2033016 RepID=UPI0026174469|nr:alkaline phosphatase family protein [Hydrocarboniphaga sp.]MDB5971195.1 phosphoesterase [Hydrocarboniphaga sp.]